MIMINSYPAKNIHDRIMSIFLDNDLELEFVDCIVGNKSMIPGECWMYIFRRDKSPVELAFRIYSEGLWCSLMFFIREKKYFLINDYLRLVEDDRLRLLLAEIFPGPDESLREKLVTKYLDFIEEYLTTDLRDVARGGEVD